jgi:signal transduction histidine kinase
MRFFHLGTRWKILKRLLKRYLAQRISRRMILNFVGLGVLPILIVSFILISLTQNTVESYIYDRNMEIARSASKEINLFIKEPLTILTTIAQTRDILEMERFTQSRLINKVKAGNPIFQKIFILDQTGLVVVTTSFGEELNDFSNSPVFSETRAGRIYYSQVYLSPSRFPVMQIALPIRKYNTVEGVLACEIDLKAIWDKVDKITLGKTGNAFLISSDGSVIAHREKERVLNKESYKDYAFYPELSKGNEGITFYKNEDEEIIAAFAPIKELSWGIVVQQSVSEAYELARKMRNRVFIIVIATTLLALILAYTTVKRITNPLEILVKGVRKYGEGNLDHRIQIQRQDELAVLAGEFNQMAESLDRNQKRLRRMERLAALSRFASLVSHEIRNPLNAMNINMQILRRLITQQESPPDKKIKYLNIISSEISRINSLVTNFLAITRPPELNLIRSDIHQILEEVIMTLEGQANTSEILVKRQYSNESLYGMFDYNQLKQVFHNIILNAFEAMPDGGQVNVKTTLVTKKDRNVHEKRIKIAFSDNGFGIPKQKLNEIFDFYFTTKKTGTGLGLAIAKQIIEGHKGTIVVESKEKKGTTVFIELPLEV